MKIVIFIIISLATLSCSKMEEDPTNEIPTDVQSFVGSWTNDDEILLDRGDPSHYTYSFFENGTFESSIISFNGCPYTDKDEACDAWYSWEKEFVGTFELENRVIKLNPDGFEPSNLTIVEFRKDRYIVLSSDDFNNILFKPGRFNVVNKAQK